jgi:hypothetical protein
MKQDYHYNVNWSCCKCDRFLSQEIEDLRGLIMKYLWIKTPIENSLTKSLRYYLLDNQYKTYGRKL